MISVRHLLQFTTTCASCKWRIPASGPFCRTCLAALEAAPALCPKCWTPHLEVERSLCDVSAFAGEAALPPLFACFPAIGQAHQVLKAWKVGTPSVMDRAVLGETTGKNQTLMTWLHGLVRPDWIVPIPQLAERRRALGGGSTIRLARHFSRALEIPWLALLEKTGRSEIPRQATLGHQNRLENRLEFQLNRERAAMTARPGVGRRLLLVDDIVTTGRTLTAAVETAHRKGYPVTGALVLGWRPQISDFAATGQSPEVRGRSP